MLHFKDWMNRLSAEHDLTPEVDGTQLIYEITLPMGTRALIRYDDVNPQIRPLARAGALAVPISRANRDEFISYVLSFNRNAIAYLPMGIIPLPHNDGLFCPTWYISRKAQPEMQWQHEFGIFEGMVLNATHNLQKMMQRWIQYQH